MNTEGTPLEYHDGDTLCRGEYFQPSHRDRPLPVVLVCPAWDGLVDEVREKSARLAAEGYIAFAVDVHGGGRTWTDFSQVSEVLGPWLADRARLLRRLQAALAAAPHSSSPWWERIICSRRSRRFSGRLALRAARLTWR